MKRGSAGGAVAPQAGAQERAPVVPCPLRLLDLADAGRYLGVSPWTIRDLEAAGTLKRVTIPIGSKELRKILFDRADLDALIDRWKVS